MVQEENRPIPDGLLIMPLGETKIISPQNSIRFTDTELTELVGGQIEIIPLVNEDNPRKRRRRIMCINAEGKELNLEPNAKARSIYDVSCWGIVVVINVRDFAGFS